MDASNSFRYKIQFIGTAIHSQHVQYHVKITGPDGASWNVKKRYSEFRDLNQHLSLKFVNNHPQVPGKKFFGNMNPSFVSQRQQELQTYMQKIMLLDPEIRTKVLQKFLNVPSQPSPAVEASKDESDARQTQAPTAAAHHQSIVEAAQNAFVDLSETSILPKQLDQMELQQRQDRYAQIVRDRIEKLAVDPALVQRAMEGCRPTGQPAEEAHGKFADESKIMEATLAGLGDVLDTSANKIGDPDKLIIPFPPVPTNCG